MTFTGMGKTHTPCKFLALDAFFVSAVLLLLTITTVALATCHPAFEFLQHGSYTFRV